MRKSLLFLFILITMFFLFGCKEKSKEKEVVYKEITFNMDGGVWEEDYTFTISKKENDIVDNGQIYIIDKNVTINHEKLNFNRIYIVKEKDNIYRIVDRLIVNDSWAKATSDYEYIIIAPERLDNNLDAQAIEKLARSLKSKDKYIKLDKDINDTNICAKVYNRSEYANGINVISIREDEYLEFDSVYKVGYKFNGWYDNSNFDGLPVEDYLNHSANTNTYYASFSLINYTINYELNGGECSDLSVNTYNYLDSDITLPTDVVKSDYSFDGWYLDSNFTGDKVEVIKAHSVGNITLYAKWISKEIHEMTDSERIDRAIINLERTYNNLGEVEEDISLILKDDETDCVVTWSSSDTSALSNAGKYTRLYMDSSVTLTAEVKYGTTSKNVSFEVLVKGFKDIKKTGIASSYIYRSYSTVDDNFFDTLDIINCAFATCNSDAELTGTNFFKVCSEHIIPKAHEKGVWVVMSIAPESSWVEVCNPSNGKVEKFADNIVKAINEYGFDGIDIDWECPTDSQKTWFTNLAKIVNEKVKKNNPNHIVSAAIGGGKWQPPRYDMANSVKYLDFVNMMTYGMTSSSGQYQNSLYANSSYKDSKNKVGYTLTSCSIVESIAIYDTYKVPHSKIIVGLAFYGIRQTREYDESSKTYSSWKSGGSIFYTSIKNNYLNNSNYTYVYDERCGVPYIISKDKTFFISFDDPRSIKEKCNYVLNNNLGGVMYWENGCDTTGDLLSAIGEVLN